MALLSAAQQAKLQGAIDLLVKGSARETPVSLDTIQWISVFLDSLQGTPGLGEISEDFKNNPITTLIGIVLGTGGQVLTQREIDQLVQAMKRMYLGSAYETPFAEDVIEQLAPAAESSGFLTRGGFYEAVKNNPVSTMLKWALKLGSIPGGGGGGACTWYAVDYATATGPGSYVAYANYAAAKAAAVGFAQPVVGWGTNFPAVDWSTLHSTDSVALYYVLLNWSWQIGSAPTLDTGGAQPSIDAALSAVLLSPSLPAGFCTS